MFDSNSLSSVDAALREETREKAIRKAKLIINIMRNSMTEIKISQVVVLACWTICYSSTFEYLSTRSKLIFLFLKHSKHVLDQRIKKNMIFLSLILKVRSDATRYHSICLFPYNRWSTS